MTQLIEPVIPGKGNIYQCLGYAHNLFGIPEKRYSSLIPFAMEAWAHADQHPGLPPKDVKVFLWFNWWGTVGGVYKNWGHVVVNVPGDGLYSSPMTKAENYHKFASIKSVESFLKATYVGWSPDVNGVKVVEDKGEEMSTWNNGATYNLLFHAVSKEVAEKAKAANFVGYFGLQDGMESNKAFNDIISSPQFDFLVADARKGTVVSDAQDKLNKIKAIVG